jgi:hypothetical protein
MLYHTQSYWASGLCPSYSGEEGGRETPTLLGPLDRAPPHLTWGRKRIQFKKTVRFLEFIIPDDGQNQETQ